MSVIFVSGDPLLTSAQTLAFGYNAEGKTEVGALGIALLTRYPAAFSSFTRQSRSGKIKAGDYWIWRDSKPHLMFLAIRQTAVGAARLRFVESIMMTIARDHRLELLNSLAIAPLSDSSDWTAMKPLINHWLGNIGLPIVVYDHYRPGVRAEEKLLV
ncbi:MAG: hypothetical protein U0694_01315 [Anaerolineae bacterium]